MATTAFPFGCIPQAATKDPRLSDLGYKIYGNLVTIRNRKTGQCNPKEQKLAEMLGKSLRTIQRAIAELRSAGMIIARRTLTGYEYELPTPDQWQWPLNPPKMAAPNPPKMAAPSRQKWRVPSLLPEPDVLEPIRADDDAVLQVVRKPVQKAAAAQDCFAFNEPEENQNPAPSALAEAEMVVAELMPLHPEPGNEPKAVAEAAQILAAKPEEMAATVETMRQTHAACRAAWANYGPGRFIPQLWRWFRDGDWKYLRPERKEVQRETYDQRRRREAKQEDEETCRMYAELDMWDAIREHSGAEAVEVWREKVNRAS